MANGPMPLNDALEACYAAFADVEKPSDIDGCECCWYPEDTRLLLDKPLRSLSGEDLSEYASSVFLTAGDLPDFRYFLPRLLDIAANDPSWWPCPEVLLKTLKLADWRSWPSEEQAVIEQVLEAWFDQCLRTPCSEESHDPAWGSGDEVLCGLAYAGLDLTPFLNRLLEPEFSAQLKGLYWMNFDKESGRTKLYNTFWSERQRANTRLDAPSGAPLVAFLERPDVRARVEAL